MRLPISSNVTAMAPDIAGEIAEHLKAPNGVLKPATDFYWRAVAYTIYLQW